MGESGGVSEIKIQERFRGPMLVFWFILVVLFATLLTLTLFGGAIALVGMGTGKGSVANLGKLVQTLLTFNAPKIDAFLDTSLVNSGMLFFFGGALLTIIVVLVQRGLERTSLKRLTVTPLLPGDRRRFIPCEEGLYTQWFRNIYTGTVWYSLRPWNTLTVDTLDETKRRITLRDTRKTMHLKAHGLPGDQTNYYDSLKQVVLGRLSPERQVPQPRKLRFRWGVCLVLVLIAVVISTAGLHSLDAHTKGKVGDMRCDVCGSGFAWDYVTVSVGGKPIHEYCQLHGLAHAIVHPLSAVRSAVISVPAIAKEDGLARALVNNSAALYGVLAWYFVAIIIFAIAAPKPLMLDR